MDPFDTYGGVCFFETSLSEARFVLSFDMISFDMIPLLSRSTFMSSGNVMSLGSNLSFSDEFTLKK